jgi:hypothetical protein
VGDKVPGSLTIGADAGATMGICGGVGPNTPVGGSMDGAADMATAGREVVGIPTGASVDGTGRGVGRVTGGPVGGH